MLGKDFEDFFANKGICVDPLGAISRASRLVELLESALGVNDVEAVVDALFERVDEDRFAKVEIGVAVRRAGAERTDM